MQEPSASGSPVNPVFTKYGLPGHITIGSNSPGVHPASDQRPVHHAEWDRPSSSGYVVSNNLVNEPPTGQPPFRIIVIGAGAAGIDFLHHAPSHLADLNVEFAVYDKNHEIGGTWFENRYPGCACDNPSVGYTFPWKAKPDWSSFYSSASEIWQYLKDIVEEENMMQYITLNTAVSGAKWDNGKAKWIVTLSQNVEGKQPKEWQEECDLILNGSGFLKYVKFLLSAGLKG